jgi:hypothetical protein
MFFRRRVELIGAGVVLALVVGLAAFWVDHHPGRAYIVYRYAHNFATGRGLAYNPAQTPFLSGVVSAPYALLLGAGMLISPDIPLLANLFGALCVAAGALILARMAGPAGKLPTLVAAGAYVTFPLLWVSLGLETPLWLSLCLMGVAFHLGGSGRGAAACLGLATLLRAEAGLLVVVLVAHSLLTHRLIEFLPAGIYSAIAGFGGLIVLSTFQRGGVLSPYIPAGLAPISPEALGGSALAGLGGLGIALFALSPLWVTVLMVCGLGALRLRAHPWAMLLGTWAALHLALLEVLGAGITAFDLAPLIPAIAALAGLGAEAVIATMPGERVQWIVGAGLALLVAATGVIAVLTIATTPPALAHNWRALAVDVSDRRVEAAATWLRQNAPPGARVAAADVGLLGYHLEQPMLDFYGALQTDVQEAAQRGDTSWWLMAYAPDYVVLRGADVQTPGGEFADQSEWFNANYVQVSQIEQGGRAAGDTLVIFQRTTPTRPLAESLIGFVTYAGGLTINGIGSDFPLFPLQSDQQGLVRLEWLLAAPVTTPQSVTIRIQGRGGGAVAALATRTVNFAQWPLHHLITSFHPIKIEPGLPSGVYEIQVGIGPDSAHVVWKDVAVAKIPFLGGTDLGGISGTRAEFGELTLLGYRVGRRAEGLEVFLLWQAERAIAADYHEVIQVRGADGAVIASQDVQPHNGAYPTSVWSPGEQVTDTILLPVSQIPPGDYQVYVSLITPDGGQVRTTTGQDAIFIGQVNIGSQ